VLSGLWLNLNMKGDKTMTTITNGNVSDYNVKGNWRISGSVKPDGTADESKKFTLDVHFDCAVQDIILKALEPTKISWANNVGRKHFDTFKNGDVIKIDFKSPGKAPEVDPMVKLINDAKDAGIDPTDKAAMTEFLMGELAKVSK
jgi:hypothetical protein